MINIAHIKYGNWLVFLYLITIILSKFNFTRTLAMSTLTTNDAQQSLAEKTPFTLASFISVLFAINLREKLAADTRGDNSDGAYTWGM